MKSANRVLLIAATLAAIQSLSAIAGPHPKVQPIETVLERDLSSGGASSHADTAWFGGSGTGNGTVVRGGLWNFEADSGEPPEFFPDGDPVGNQFRDGWTFEDRTTRHGPSQVGAPHFNAGRVRLKVYDVGGRLVRTLVDQVQAPSSGGYQVTWDGTNDAGARAGSGVYFYELDSPGFAASRKLVMLE